MLDGLGADKDGVDVFVLQGPGDSQLGRGAAEPFGQDGHLAQFARLTLDLFG